MDIGNLLSFFVMYLISCSAHINFQDSKCVNRLWSYEWMNGIIIMSKITRIMSFILCLFPTTYRFDMSFDQK